MKKKARYVTLRDRRRQPRVIMCFLEGGYGSLTRMGLTGIGIAIRSELDKNDFKVGRQLAYRRAVRGCVGRKPCILRLTNAVKNIYSLNFKDFKFLMQFTDGKVAEFPKSMSSAISADQLIEEARCA